MAAVPGTAAGVAVAPPSACARVSMAWWLVGHLLYLLTYLLHLLPQPCMVHLDPANSPHPPPLLALL